MPSRDVTDSVNFKAAEIQAQFAGRVQASADLNEVAEWASAFIVYGGALFGAIHAKKNQSIGRDQEVAEEQKRNLLTAMQVGRSEGMRS